VIDANLRFTSFLILTDSHRLAVVGVDIMDFYVYTARARFSSISEELQAEHEGPLVYGGRQPNKLFPAACLGSGLDLRWIADGTFSKYVALSPINHFDDKVCPQPVMLSIRFHLHSSICSSSFLGRRENGVRGVQSFKTRGHRLVWNGE
jgi:hypothetical protein